MSEPHTLASAILTTTAPGLGSGTGYSRISNVLPLPIQAASFPVFAMSVTPPEPAEFFVTSLPSSSCDRRAPQLRQRVTAEELDGPDGIGGEADAEHQPLDSRLGRRAHLHDAIVGRTGDRETRPQVIEEAESLHECSIHRPLACGVEAESLAHGRYQRPGNATPLGIGAEHVGRDEAQNVAELGEGNVPSLRTVQTRDVPRLDFVARAPGLPRSRRQSLLHVGHLLL